VVEEPFAPPPTRTRRRVASRIVPVQAATIAIVVATALGLVAYFALRG
jgi:hypothetical protein